MRVAGAVAEGEARPDRDQPDRIGQAEPARGQRHEHRHQQERNHLADQPVHRQPPPSPPLRG
jgi:hypothetical protein